jgi:hypothetical protein
MLYELSKQIEGHTICALGDGAAWPVQVGQSSNIVSYGHTICTVGMVGTRRKPHHMLYRLHLAMSGIQTHNVSGDKH